MFVDVPVVAGQVAPPQHCWGFITQASPQMSTSAGGLMQGPNFREALLECFSNQLLASNPIP
jgi:hypothetical protein